MSKTYPPFVENAGLDAESLARLERGVDATTRLRALPGTIGFAIFALVFSLATELGARFPTFSFCITMATLVASAARWRVLRRCPDEHATAASRLSWRRAWDAMNYTSVALYAIHIAVAILLLGIGTTTFVMMMVSTGVVVGLAHALSPRQSLMRGCALVLLVPTLCATLATTGPGKYVVAALIGLMIAYVFFLGHRLGVEYWRSAVAEAQLGLGRDELLRSQRQTRNVIEKTPDAMGIFCGDEVVFVNAAWTSSLRCAPADVIGKSFEDFVRPEDVERLRRLLLASSTSVASEEFCVLRRDGTTVTWEISPGATLEYDGRTARPVIARDVTERNRMRAQLLRSERLASIGTLAAGVGHEINNPLTYVLANLEYAMTEMTERAVLTAEKTRELAELIGEALEGAERVRVIVRDLRVFSCVEESLPQAVDVHDAIDLAVKMTAEEVGHRARVVLRRSDVPLVAANELKLGQVLVNLLTNAAYAIPEGHAEDNEIRISTGVDASGSVILEVSDTGLGISPSNLPRIFDPFFTTKPVGVGSGLGLSICDTSVRSFGGEITVTSEVGRGTTFVISLPSVARIAKRASVPAPDVDGSASRARILVVDDEVGVGVALRRALLERYDLVLETSAQRALSRLEAGESFDVVLCDLIMPEMTGIELFDRVVERFPTYAQKLLFMTGGAFTAEAAAFVERIGNSLVEKPFDLTSLVAKLEQRLGHP